MCETTFEKARPGDRVWSIQCGWGNFRKHAEYDTEYPVIIDFPKGDCLQFTMDGRHFKGENRSLFWDEIKITPPPRPKRKIKKEVTRWMNIYSPGHHTNQNDDGSFSVWESSEKADLVQCARIACVELKGEYEIEE